MVFQIKKWLRHFFVWFYKGKAALLINRTTRKNLPVLLSNAGKFFLGLGLSAKRCKLFSRSLLRDI
ncbi:MAG: hypothetical protein DCE90_08970 [Pseudanabaena sp.]|nr:MAG: hypothetical protein DCE90_08970 [Pseudanabaena sp.]